MYSDSKILFNKLLPVIKDLIKKNFNPFGNKESELILSAHEQIFENFLLPIITNELLSLQKHHEDKIIEVVSETNSVLRAELEEYFPNNFFPDLTLEERIKKCFETDSNLVIKLQSLVISYYQKLDIMKEKRTRFEIERWSDQEIQERILIEQLTGVISDLNKILKL